MSILTLDDTDIVANFGRGRFSEILCYRSKDSATGFVAVKRFTLRSVGEDTSRSIRNFQEQLVLSKLSSSSPGSRDQPSAYIMQLLHVQKDEFRWHLIISAAFGGSLHKHIQHSSAGNCLLAPIVRGYAAELVSALLHLRKHQCVHRDIKANNVMLDHHGHVQLVDFGSSKFLEPPAACDSSVTLDVLGNMIVPNPDADQTYPNQRTYTFTGTLHAMAPEMAAGTGHSFPVDWWALGVLMHEMLCGSPPAWTTATPAAIATATGAGTGTALGYDHASSTSMSRLISDRVAQAGRALDRVEARAGDAEGAGGTEEKEKKEEKEDKNERGAWEWQYTSSPTAACYTDSSLGEAAGDLVSGLLHVNPAHRMLYRAVEMHPFFAAVQWQEVHSGTSRSPCPEFDQRLGFMDLLDSSVVAGISGDGDDLTEAQQALFADF
jgi:serine/threonine protein kinase